MADDQRHGHIFGVLFIITFITSIAALALYQSVLDDPVGYITGGGKDNQIYLGALLEFFLIVSGVGTAVALYPIARRQNEALAIGYVAARIMECVFSLLTLKSGVFARWTGVVALIGAAGFLVAFAAVLSGLGEDSLFGFGFFPGVLALVIWSIATSVALYRALGAPPN